MAGTNGSQHKAPKTASPLSSQRWVVGSRLRMIELVEYDDYVLDVGFEGTVGMVDDDDVLVDWDALAQPAWLLHSDSTRCIVVSQPTADKVSRADNGSVPSRKVSSYLKVLIDQAVEEALDRRLGAGACISTSGAWSAGFFDDRLRSLEKFSPRDCSVARPSRASDVGVDFVNSREHRILKNLFKMREQLRQKEVLPDGGASKTSPSPTRRASASVSSAAFTTGKAAVISLDNVARCLMLVVLRSSMHAAVRRLEDDGDAGEEARQAAEKATEMHRRAAEQLRELLLRSPRVDPEASSSFDLIAAAHRDSVSKTLRVPATEEAVGEPLRAPLAEASVGKALQFSSSSAASMVQQASSERSTPRGRLPPMPQQMDGGADRMAPPTLSAAPPQVAPPMVWAAPPTATPLAAPPLVWAAPLMATTASPAPHVSSVETPPIAHNMSAVAQMPPVSPRGIAELMAKNDEVGRALQNFTADLHSFQSVSPNTKLKTVQQFVPGFASQADVAA